MKEFQKQLEEYASKYYQGYSLSPMIEWDNGDVAEAYLDKYWLGEGEYYSSWIEPQRKIFRDDFVSLPDKVFCDELQLIPMVGGTLFSVEDFQALQTCMREVGDTFFAIVQNTPEVKDVPVFRMKYPAEISWDELMSGSYISTVLFEYIHGDYFVFGDTGVWGKYVNNDAEIPLDLIGARAEYVMTFADKYEDVRKDYELRLNAFSRQELLESLPKDYLSDFAIHL